MTDKTQGLFRMPPGVIHRLRQSLERVVGDQAAPMLQEAGFSAGDDVYAEFTSWLKAEEGIDDPPAIDAEHLGDVVSRFFQATGWGEISLERMGTAALCITAPSWAEASPKAGSDLPSCHITTGMLAAFLGRVADDVVAVMEVECRTQGDARCRFLIGSPETLQIVFDGLSQGSDYETVLITAP